MKIKTQSERQGVKPCFFVIVLAYCKMKMYNIEYKIDIVDFRIFKKGGGMK